MAILAAGPDEEVRLTLRPYSIAEEGRPTWLSTELRLNRGDEQLVSTTISITRDDLGELRSGLLELVAGARDTFSMTTLDEDFFIVAGSGNRPGDVYIGFWHGEPYGTMIGYRFVARAPQIDQFVRHLQEDEDSLTGNAS